MSRLILCGAGHVSHALAQVAALLDFELCVLDDRREFADPARFPPGAQVLALPFDEGLTRLGSRPDDFFCILTRGHTWDRDCLARILNGRFAYVGMIGSRRKVAATMEALAAEGYSEEMLACVHAPIGLMLGGQTPAEVAVEIAAQLIQVRAELGPALAPPPMDKGILCTILKKTGSAPRGPGAWMLVYPDGHTVGTVGGGAVEYQVSRDALDLWVSGESAGERAYDLGSGADLGMVCGGSITVRFQRQ
ncbi:MAG: XdhC/CoxI family protein [Pseudoflavonifractor sp.]|nr:XdhC/CoxI family protein [Pseudoflavonifractor sp.]